MKIVILSALHTSRLYFPKILLVIISVVGRDRVFGILCKGWTVLKSNPGGGVIFRARSDRL
jgi:hypothetical protein